MTSRVGIFVLLLPPEIHKEGIEERERERREKGEELEVRAEEGWKRERRRENM